MAAPVIISNGPAGQAFVDEGASGVAGTGGFGAHVPGDLFVLMIGNRGPAVSDWTVSPDPSNIYKPLGPLVTVPKPVFHVIGNLWFDYTAGTSGPMTISLHWAKADYAFSGLAYDVQNAGVTWSAQAWNMPFVIRGADVTDPIDSFVLAHGPNALSPSFVIPGIETHGPDRLILAGANGQIQNLGTGSISHMSSWSDGPISSFVEAWNSLHFAATSRSLGGISGVMAGAGATGDISGISGSSAPLLLYTLWALAIKPGETQKSWGPRDVGW